ncbi:helix-turn-helix domain-containing protein [Moheibacter sediminis]|uniref:Helix-turn-helix domain-containing protein n=1 Tax=Moheibacter sediminis TaxID=1434700 RepID=A0A1W2B5F7_9FLAO|nr:helix-turn-helix domain-containing protein [Moheibacter sediminis]SMC68010.1 Helix-turn-helix domain-containing protein [Moheibacter sediminis]
MKILENILFYLFLLVGNILFAQNPKIPVKNTFKELRSHYENMEENNQRALPFVNAYLEKAKKENNYDKIIQGYRDFIFFSPKREDKLVYADSCISYALNSKNNELISKAYLGKGILYYFFYKKYQPALDNYLKAYQYSENIEDKYLKNSIIYHIGVVKSYLGYYDEALMLFNECITYFEPLTIADIHPNLVFNNQKGYFNSLHQKIICYQQLGNHVKSDSLIQIGLSTLPHSQEFALEKSYFLKSKAVSNYYKNDFNLAIIYFNNALPELKKINDFTWFSVSYFYLGKCYLKTHRKNLAIPYFMKVDSIFQKNKFILPQIRENYEILIHHFHSVENHEQELHYTRQLLKVDSVLNKDFKYLSSKMHKEYSTKALLKKQEQLENRNSIGFNLLIAASVLTFVLLINLIYRSKKEKEIQQKYIELEKRIIKQNNQRMNTNVSMIINPIQKGKTEKPAYLIEEILQKLEKFEQNKGFRKKGLTQSQLAKKFETNTTYLSQVINEYKMKNFNTYLNNLRMNYITHELYHNPKYLEYTIEALAEDCGISSRQNFSDLFNEVNGIRPADFIRKRRELRQKESSISLN